MTKLSSSETTSEEITCGLSRDSTPVIYFADHAEVQLERYASESIDDENNARVTQAPMITGNIDRFLRLLSIGF